MKPIKVFHWRGENFGDALSLDVVAHVSGRQAVWAGPLECDLFAVGSVISLIGERFSEAPENGHLPFMWGSGILSPRPSPFMSRIEVVALRGPITAALTNQAPALPYGDPGLFADELLDERPEQADRIGLVPHWQLVDTPEMRDLARDPRIDLIDPRTTDALSVVRRIAACRFVLSSSLHRHIVADALGIPNPRLTPIGAHATPTLKFIDYAAAIGRLLGAPLDPDQVPGYLSALRSETMPETLPYADGIAAAKQALRDSFPAELRAN